MQQIAEHSGATLRGRGMLRGVRFEDPAVAGRAAAAAFDRKLLVETSGSNDEVIKLMPPLTITDEQLQRGLALLDEAVRAAGAAVLVRKGGPIRELVDAIRAAAGAHG